MMKKYMFKEREKYAHREICVNKMRGNQRTKYILFFLQIAQGDDIDNRSQPKKI